jgi:hypothetical protein
MSYARRHTFISQSLTALELISRTVEPSMNHALVIYISFAFDAPLGDLTLKSWCSCGVHTVTVARALHRADMGRKFVN